MSTEITHFSVLYIDQIPDELNSSVWNCRIREMACEMNEGGEPPILRDACREHVHCVLVDHDMDLAPDDPAPYSPTVYIRMVPDQRQMMVVVPYAIDPGIKKFMGRPCHVQSSYKCERPIDRTAMIHLMQDKARQFNSLLFEDGSIVRLREIARTYDHACASVLAAYAINSRIKLPHRMRGSLFPVENFSSELDERSDEVFAKRKIDPTFHRTGKVVLELVDSFPSDRPHVAEVIEGEKLCAFRRMPAFSSEFEPAACLQYRRTRYEGKPRSIIERLWVNNDDRRKGYASMMLIRLAKTYPNDVLFASVENNDYESLAFFQSVVKKKAIVAGKKNFSIKFGLWDLLPRDYDADQPIAENSEKK